MTIAEAEKFYKQDTKKYDIKKNKELLTWLRKAIKNGYHSYIDIEDLQKLIDNITDWYEIKYPELAKEFYEGALGVYFSDMETLSGVMDIKQLVYRLPKKQLSLMECLYRSTSGLIRDVYNDKGEIVGKKHLIGMRIYRKDECDFFDSPYFYSKSKESRIFAIAPATFNLPYFYLKADSVTGKVDVDYNLKKYINVNSITLDKLLYLFKEKYTDKLDFTKLEECVYNHNCDIELRRKILQLVALKLLYSKKTTPERGYERALDFINEFNESMNLNLSTEEIDLAMNKNYPKEESTLPKKY